VDVLQDHFRGPDLSEHLVPTVGGSTCAGCSNVFSWLDVTICRKTHVAVHHCSCRFEFDQFDFTAIDCASVSPVAV
jgi:hypothetical protein